jgi:hypothetical protein
VDYHLTGIGQSSKHNRWESSIDIDLSVFVQERVRRRILCVEVQNKKRQADAMLLAVPKPASKNTIGSKTLTQNETLMHNFNGPDHQFATTLAANIITAHIEETKRLIQMYGAGLSTGHLITLRKKTDSDLSKLLVGNSSLINESGRVEMMKRAEDSALQSMRQATGSLSHSNPLSAVLMPDASQVLQTTISTYPVVSSATNINQSAPSIDLNEIMKTGNPFDWSKQVVQQHKEFTRFLCLQHGQSTFPDRALDGSRHQCIENLFKIFETAGIRYSSTQISAVIKEAENEARADFMASSKNSSEGKGGHNLPFVSPSQQQTMPAHGNAPNTLELQNLQTTQNAKNPYVESGAAQSSNNMLQSQNMFQSTVPAAGANVTSNIAFQTTNNNFWHPQQATMNVNPTVQPWQLANCNGVTSQIGTYPNNPQLQQSSFLQSYNANRTEQNNTVTYMSQSPQLQQQQWLSSQQQVNFPVSSTLYMQQQQLPQQSYNMGTQWPSTMSSSIPASQQQSQYQPQSQMQQNWPSDQRLWSQQQQPPQYQPQNGTTNNNNNNWNTQSSRGC